MAAMWEVVGGGANGGIMVRAGQDLKSEEASSRLATGAKVRQLELVGERMRYEKVEGAGPETGWISLTLKGKDLVVRCEGASGGAAAAAAAPKSSGPIVSVAPPQNVQIPGKPYFFYHQIGFVETKPTGLRMSAVMAAMDDCRCDVHSYCDVSAEALRKATDPHTEIALELLPVIRELSNENAADGIVYCHPEARGPVMSWLRCEAEFGWPAFPFKVEEQNAYLVGKVKSSSQRTHICKARFFKALVDDATGSLCTADPWEKVLDQFYAKVKAHHSQERLAQMPLKKLYSASGKPFTPTHFARTRWMMTSSFGDLWDLHYHAKTPELLWDVNMLAGGPFAKLVEADQDPQAIAVTLTKKMKVGTFYDCLCYVDPAAMKAAYVLLPEGQKMPSEAVISICALYKWDSVPKDGATLCSEDLDVASGVGRVPLINWALNNAEAKAGKVSDLTKLTRPAA